MLQVILKNVKSKSKNVSEMVDFLLSSDWFGFGFSLIPVPGSTASFQKIITIPRILILAVRGYKIFIYSKCNICFTEVSPFYFFLKQIKCLLKCLFKYCFQ